MESAEGPVSNRLDSIKASRDSIDTGSSVPRDTMESDSATPKTSTESNSATTNDKIGSTGPKNVMPVDMLSETMTLAIKGARLPAPTPASLQYYRVIRPSILQRAPGPAEDSEFSPSSLAATVSSASIASAATKVSSPSSMETMETSSAKVAKADKGCKLLSTPQRIKCLVTHCATRQGDPVKMVPFPWKYGSLCRKWFKLCTKECPVEKMPSMPRPTAGRGGWRRFLICSLHFAPDDLEKSLIDELLGRPVKIAIKPGAVPSRNLTRSNEEEKAAQSRWLSRDERVAIKARKALVEEILQEDAKKQINRSNEEEKAAQSRGLSRDERAAIKARKALVEEILQEDAKKQINGQNKENGNLLTQFQASSNSSQQIVFHETTLPALNNVMLLPQVLYLDKDVLPLNQKLELEEEYINLLIRENRIAVELEKAASDFQLALIKLNALMDVPSSVDVHVSQVKQATALHDQLNEIKLEIAKHQAQRTPLTEPKSVVEMLRIRIVKDDETKRALCNQIDACQKEIRTMRREVANHKKRAALILVPKKVDIGAKKQQRQVSDPNSKGEPHPKRIKIETEALNLSEETIGADEETDAAINSILKSAACHEVSSDVSTIHDEDLFKSDSNIVPEEFSFETACGFISQPPTFSTVQEFVNENFNSTAASADASQELPECYDGTEAEANDPGMLQTSVKDLQNKKPNQSTPKIKLRNIPDSVEIILIPEKEGSFIQLSQDAILELEEQVSEIGPSEFADVSIPILMQMSVDGKLQTFMLRPAVKKE